MVLSYLSFTVSDMSGIKNSFLLGNTSLVYMKDYEEIVGIKISDLIELIGRF